MTQAQNIIGPQLRRLREGKGLTQEAFAAKCQIAGLDLSRSTLAKIESRVRCVTDRELIQLARVLKVPVSDFFAGK